MRFIVDFGPTGPDQGAGGRYLLLPPGYEDEEPDGYIVVRLPTYRVWAMVRAPTELVGTGETAVEWYRQNLRAYPLATGPRDGEYMNVSGRRFTQLPPEDATAFAWFDEIVQYEPDDLFSVEQRGRLATLGIHTGQPFDPDGRMRGIFDRAAQLGAAMSRAVCFANRRHEAKYWPDRQWETVVGGTSDFVVDGALDPDPRTLWHPQAIVVTPAMASVREGVGSVYLGVCRDGRANTLTARGATGSTCRRTRPRNSSGRSRSTTPRRALFCPPASRSRPSPASGNQPRTPTDPSTS